MGLPAYETGVLPLNYIAENRKERAFKNISINKHKSYKPKFHVFFMKILVTGGAGFIGSHIVDKLIDEGHEVVVMDNLSSGFIENINKKAKFYNRDIRDNLNDIFEKEKIDIVYHLAAQIDVRKSVENPVEDANISLIGGLNLLENCRKYKIKKIIFSSTGGAMYKEEDMPASEENREEPICPYGIVKLSLEKYIKFYSLYGIDYAILRYSNVYGPRQNSKGEAGVIAIFIDKILKGEKILVNGDGLQTRDYVYVGDVAKANILAMNLKGIFNVSTCIEKSLLDIIEILKRHLGNFKIEHREAVKGEVRKSCLKWDKIKEQGWEPEIKLEEGIKKTLYWFLERNKNLENI